MLEGGRLFDATWGWNRAVARTEALRVLAALSVDVGTDAARDAVDAICVDPVSTSGAEVAFETTLGTLSVRIGRRERRISALEAEFVVVCPGAGGHRVVIVAPDDVLT